MEAENAAFWLPEHFLTDDDFLADWSITKDQKNFDLFSTGFDPFGLDSPVSSAETERDKDDGELLAELTRQLAHSTLRETTYNPTEKPWGFSTSPQSTLTGFGPWSNRSGISSNGSPNSPSRVPSPPLTPPGAKNDAAWELLYEAAGQVARLKMTAMAQMNHHHQQQQQNRGFLGAPRNPKSDHINGFYDHPRHNQFQQVKRQGSVMWGQGRPEMEDLLCHHHHHHHLRRQGCGGGHGGCGEALGLPQSAWPSLRAGHPQHPHLQQPGCGGSGMRAVFLNGSGSGLRRQSTGTGVFLPRRVGTHQQPEPRKKPTGCSTVLLPARVIQALNLDLEEVNNGGSNLDNQSRFATGFVSDHDLLMGRRNAAFGQQRRSQRQDGMTTMVGHEIRLPSDWTY